MTKILCKFVLFIAVFLFIFNSYELKSKEFAKLMEIKGGISPATFDFIKTVIKECEDNKNQFLIIRLDTPGGLLDATRNITGAMMKSKIPIIVFVGPSGARAGSAGVFITLASHIAIMSPGTNIGAAHPVNSDGGDIDSIMNEKVTNDASAYIRSIAKERNRNINWAERTVRESISSTAQEALDSNVIDYIVSDVDSIINIINGRTVITQSNTITLNTTNTRLEYRQANWREELTLYLADPNIAYIFILLAIYGILIEFYNPGSIFPGVVGAISAILAAYSLQMMPVNIAAIGLIILSIVLFIMEIKIVSFGLLSIAGVISFVLGSILLIDSTEEYMSISLEIIITATVLTFLFFAIIIFAGLKSQFRKKQDSSNIIGGSAIVIKDISGNQSGLVRFNGEIWTAFSNDNLYKDNEVVITKSEGLKLWVESKQKNVE